MDALHSDLLSSVALFLPLPSLAVFRRVCKRWLQLSSSEKFCRGYYYRYAPTEMRIAEAPSGTTWSQVHRRLPLLLRSATALHDCTELWPSMVAEHQRFGGATCGILIRERRAKEELFHGVEIHPDFQDTARFLLKRSVASRRSQPLYRDVADLYTVLLSLLLDGGRSLSLECPLESTGRPLVSLLVLRLIDGDNKYSLLPQ